MKKNILILWVSLMILPLFSCSSGLSNNSTYWVDGLKVKCNSGAGDTQCLKIHRGEDLSTAKWELFYSNIKGFAFEEGVLQKIEVKEQKLDVKNIPADASSIQYTLVKVLDKKQDVRLLLNGSWVANKINGNAVNPKTPQPKLTINLLKKQVSGSDSCNNIGGAIDRVTQSTIKFGNLFSTRMMCKDMSRADAFNKAMNETETYRIKDEHLVFYDNKGKEVVVFLKVEK